MGKTDALVTGGLPRGLALLHDPLLNKGQAFTERDALAPTCRRATWWKRGKFASKPSRGRGSRPFLYVGASAS
jgi:hypothetical protein